MRHPRHVKAGSRRPRPARPAGQAAGAAAGAPGRAALDGEELLAAFACAPSAAALAEGDTVVA
ncbi:MAG TPA: hypothetical protein VIV59_08970, partial [Anaeromyxobacteraceae bacterium]